MAPKKRTTRSSPATTTPTTTPATDEQLRTLIAQGVVDALAERDATKSRNGEDSHDSGIGELALMCVRMFPEESNKIEKYVGGLPDMIHGSVMASKPKTMQDAIKFATELIDKKISTLAERQSENKRKPDNNNQAQQQPLKKQGVAIAYTIRPGKRKEYVGTLPLCNKCKFHHNGMCTINLISGETPVILESGNDENAIVTIIGDIVTSEDIVGFGVEQVIFVRDESEKSMICKYVRNHALVVTRVECKGLEFQLFYENSFVMATMCFERTGDTKWEKLTKASGLKASVQQMFGTNFEAAFGYLSDAGDMFASIGKHDSAATCRCASGNYV
nr:UvrD-like helicase, ATP-binding domain, P-loop containing nucleoside triphosphate hydrolase [Tanacetum cinerariifolium]